MSVRGNARASALPSRTVSRSELTLGNRIQRRTCVPKPRLSVIGTGYLGATHAVCMTELGYEVIGLDVDPTKIAKLASGEVPFFEPGLAELLQKNLDTGRLRFTTSWTEVAEFADVHFVCVG